MNISQQSSSLNDDHSAPLLSLAVPYASSSEANGQSVVSGTLSQPTPSPPLGKKFSGHPHNGVDSSGEAQLRNGRARGDARGRNQLLPRYWPRITDQELQQISGEYPLITHDFLYIECFLDEFFFFFVSLSLSIIVIFTHNLQCSLYLCILFLIFRLCTV